MSEPIKVCVILEGGLIQNMFIASGDADVFVIDHDISDVDEDEEFTLSNIPVFDDGEEPIETQRVLLWKWELRERDRDPKFLLQIKEEYEKKAKWIGK